MSRYFIEVSYKGTAYAGFQVQENAVTVQEMVERALEVFLRQKVSLTGSSRTDTGVHALQNYFHFDFDGRLDDRNVYNINSLLPGDIAVKSVVPVGDNAHCRFDAIARQYMYRVYHKKDPFIADRAYYYPYAVDIERMGDAAAVVKEYSEFGAFSKRNTQAKTRTCSVIKSEWVKENEEIVYYVKANRFLRGMVRGLVGTMLQVGRKKITVEKFREIIEKGESKYVDFSVPGSGLCLQSVEYCDGYFG